ncbi:MAG: hypothetical protein RL757_170 [Bacteroidota bacterium]
MDFNKEQVIDNISTHYSILTEDCKKDFKDLSKIRTFDKSTMLVREGQYADKTYFIVQGCARAFYLKDGKDITDWFAFENDFMSSINSVFLFIPSPHYIEVLEQTTLLEITRDHMMKLCDKYHDFDRLGRIVTTKTMLQLQQRIVSVQFETALQKYENLLNIRPDITQRIPLTHIASYLGITLETLSRIRNPKNRI